MTSFSILELFGGALSSAFVTSDLGQGWYYR